MSDIDVRVEQFPVYVKKDVPVTINYRLLTDGAPPPVGSSIQFRFYGNANFLHASTPARGAKVTTANLGGHTFVWITITDVQDQGWNGQRTLTVMPAVSLNPSSLSQLCAIVINQPYEVGYWPVYARGDTSEAAIESRFIYKTKWLDIQSKCWVYSYDIFLKAALQTVPSWKLSFCDLPLGTKIHSDTWAVVTHDASEGVVELATPDNDKYVLNPGQELPVSIQLRYPAEIGQKPELEELRYLVAYPQ